MTTESSARARSGALFAVVVLVCIGAAMAACAGNEARHGDRVDVSKYPTEIQDAYRVFALRCSRCHTLARPLNARIHDPEHWIRYVTRMRRQPGSGIDAANAQIILRFLLYYHGDRQQPDREGKP